MSLHILKLSSVVLLLFACQSTTNDSMYSFAASTSKTSFPSEFVEMLEAHGGIDLWNSKNMLEFSLELESGKERHQVDLSSRKVVITHDDWKIVNDGSEVWVSPSKEAYGKRSARFYHNVYAYFFAMPFVLADPGTKHELLALDTIGGQMYQPIKVTFERDIGDAPEDVYIAYINPTTKRMEILLYTVTFYTGELSDKYSAIKYSDWQTVGGLLVPLSMQGYKYDGNELGDQRYDRSFLDVQIGTEKFDSGLFERPTKFEIDSL